MFIRCPRCELAYGAPAPGAPCPRCGTPGVAPTVTPTPQIPPTTATPQFTPATQVAPIFASPTRPMPTAPAAPPPGAMLPPTPATQAWSQEPRVYGGYRDPRVPMEDRGAIAGTAATAAALSALAVVGCCNPLGWIALLLAVRAYASTGDADLGPAAQRARTARNLGLAAFVSTTLVWVVGVGLWLFEPA